MPKTKDKNSPPHKAEGFKTPKKICKAPKVVQSPTERRITRQCSLATQDTFTSMEGVVEAPASNTCMVDVNFNTLLFSQKHECVRRARHISDVAYDVKLNLPRGEHYSGFV